MQRPCITVLTALCLLIGFRAAAASDTPFGENRKGLVGTTRTIQAGGKSFDVTIEDSDTSTFSVRILAAGPLVAKQSQLQRGVYTSSGLPLTDFKVLSAAVAAISGGYLSSYAPAEALGYVQVDQKVENRKHSSWLVDGILCTRAGSPEIRPTKGEEWDELTKKFTDCLQAGPRLVTDGKVVFPSDDMSAGARKFADLEAAHAFVCIDDRRHFLFGVTSAVTIGPVSEYLAKPRTEGGLGCQQALRLNGRCGLVSGDATSGVIDTLIPNAIAIEERSAAARRSRLSAGRGGAESK